MTPTDLAVLVLLGGEQDENHHGARTLELILRRTWGSNLPSHGQKGKSAWRKHRRKVRYSLSKLLENGQVKRVSPAGIQCFQIEKGEKP